MQKRHFKLAADLVHNILDGHWTDNLPEWAPVDYVTPIETSTDVDGNINPDRVRAIWTAEAFIKLFSEFNPLFDESRFLIACGLKDAPVKAKRSRKVSHA